MKMRLDGSAYAGAPHVGFRKSLMTLTRPIPILSGEMTRDRLAPQHF